MTKGQLMDDKKSPATSPDVEKTTEEWQSELTPDQYRITRTAGTEAPFSHEYNDNKDDGTYNCVCCGTPLFGSDTKYDSGSGWPSFYAPKEDGNIAEHEDTSLFRTRTEVTCKKCEAHLGHVFPDGPEPTGLRYCINGEALSFNSEQNDTEDK